jgi:hypothetical protein
MQTAGNERAQAMLRQQGIHDWPIGWADYITVCRLLTFQFFNVIVYLVRLQQKLAENV